MKMYLGSAFDAELASAEHSYFRCIWAWPLMPNLRRRSIVMYLGLAFDAELASAEHQ